MRGLFLLLGVAAAAVGVWVMVASMDESEPVATEQEVEEPQESSAELTGDVRLAKEQVGARSAVEGGADEAVRGFAQVLVTRKDTGEPLAGVEVWYFDTSGFTELTSEEQEEWGRLRDPEDQTRRFGVQARADDRGLVVLPVTEYLHATGRHGRLYGKLGIARSQAEEDHQLQLESDFAFAVRVIDSLGNPAAGVPIGIQPLTEDGAVPGVSLYMLGDSGPDGSFTLAHLQESLRQWESWQTRPVAFLLRARIPGWTEGGERFDPHALGEEPIVLQLPPAGRVEVRGEGPDGLRLRGQVFRGVYLTVDGERWVEQTVDGVVVFDRVVAGRDYQAGGRANRERVEQDLVGPLSEGHQVDALLSFEEDVFILTGRAVDEKGTPLRTQLRLSYHVDRAWGFRTLDTTEDGIFHTYVASPSAGMTVDSLVIEGPSEGSVPEVPVLLYTMVGEMQLYAGENDLGDVLLAPAPLVVAGRVLADGTVPQEREFNVTVLAPDERAARWSPSTLSVRYPAPDRFEVRGVVGSGRHGLAMQAPKYLPPEDVEFVPGTDDLLIELESGGSLQAVVLVDEEIKSDKLWLRLRPADGQVHIESADVGLEINPQYNNRFFGRAGLKREGAYQYSWPVLWPGRYRLEVFPRGAGSPLVAVPDIRIEAGEASEDPRLREIDLRGKVRRIHVQVVDTFGAPVVSRESGHAIVLVDHHAPEKRLEGFTVRVAGADLVTAEPSVDLLVVARGFQPRTVRGVSTDTIVMLDAFPEFVVKLAGSLPQLPRGISLRASVDRPRRDERRQYASENSSGSLQRWFETASRFAEIDERGQAILVVTGSGNDAVRVSVARTRQVQSIDGLSVSNLGPNDEGRVVFEVRIPPGELQKAIQRLRDG